LFPAVEAQSTSKAVRPTLDSSWQKLRTREIEQALNEQSPDKAPDKIKTIAIQKAWKSQAFPMLFKRLFNYCIQEGHHPRPSRNIEGHLCEICDGKVELDEIENTYFSCSECHARYHFSCLDQRLFIVEPTVFLIKEITIGTAHNA
jgi:hypothetical protein